jgi:hypothetical protein
MTIVNLDTSTILIQVHNVKIPVKVPRFAKERWSSRGAGWRRLRKVEAETRINLGVMASLLENPIDCRQLVT